MERFDSDLEQQSKRSEQEEENQWSEEDTPEDRPAQSAAGQFAGKNGAVRQLALDPAGLPAKHFSGKIRVEHFERPGVFQRKETGRFETRCEKEHQTAELKQLRKFTETLARQAGKSKVGYPQKGESAKEFAYRLIRDVLIAEEREKSKLLQRSQMLDPRIRESGTADEMQFFKLRHFSNDFQPLIGCFRV